MLSLKSAVPVNLGVVEFESAVPFTDLHVHIIWTGEDFISECTKLGCVAYIVDFVDDSCYAGVFVYENFGCDFLVG